MRHPSQCSRRNHGAGKTAARMGADILGARLAGHRGRYMDFRGGGYGRSSFIGRGRHTGYFCCSFHRIFPFENISRGKNRPNTVSPQQPDGCAKNSELVEKMMRAGLSKSSILHVFHWRSRLTQAPAACTRRIDAAIVIYSSDGTLRPNSEASAGPAARAGAQAQRRPARRARRAPAFPTDRTTAPDSAAPAFLSHKWGSGLRYCISVFVRVNAIMQA